MKRINLFVLLVLAGIHVLQAQDKPNIIFVLTDDQSYGYLGCTGNPDVKTPHIDAMAEQGMLFTNAHVTSAICTPSRASIFLSQFERKHGVNFNSGTSMSAEAWAESYPMVFRKNGYYTAYIGKNHVPIGKDGYSSNVIDTSFDFWYAGHGHLSFYPKNRHAIFKGASADTQPEIIAEGATHFLSNDEALEGAVQALAKRPADKPFMMSVCFNIPHGASAKTMKSKKNDPEMYKSMYRNQELSLPAKHYVAKADIQTPKLPATLHHARDRQTGYDYVDTPEALTERYIRQLQCMSGIDAVVGKIQEKLQELKLDKNTIIVYSSDHGLMMGEFGIGGKALCYERCTHVPIIVFNPMLKKKKRGKRSNALVQSIDIAPTLLAYAGIPIPASYQGKDITGLVEGSQSKVRDFLFTENLWSTQFGNPRCEAVQDGNWKYIRYYQNSNFSAVEKIKYAKQMGLNVNHVLYRVRDNAIPQYRYFVEAPLQGEKPVYEELFHLAIDPDETTNLAYEEKHSKKLMELRAIWKKEIKAARGSGKPKVERYTYEKLLEEGKEYTSH